ncbi:hypothetical protein ACFOOM_16845 [Streptomyces echinoruber]|uniref:Secreted protein n=1 Tax=Streptomyces echinoruber TaxID=68898 RepID=A0A918V9Y1_9ACTN|nr:hypothetical protein [Streptomyces echinoruber]GGZ85314.1 hypothetical protein GCM10010389_24460 [Streptomyces echinoruber]
MLPPAAIAGVSLVCALGPWLFTEPAVLRTLAAVAAATALVGAAVMRRWDVQAGKRVADLVRARASDEWRFEERLAELETDLEEARELRGRLEQKLRAKRAELAALRNEHAALLRRYATAETERASALEGRRLLELEAAVPAEDTDAAGATDATDNADGFAGPAPEDAPAQTGLSSPEGARLFQRAAQALARLAGADDDERTRDASAERRAAASEAEAQADGERDGDGPAAADGHRRTAAPEAAARGGVPGRQPSGHFTVPPAKAVVPPAPVRPPAAEGGFDFFGTKKGSPKRSAAAGLGGVQNEDLADVVGQEALALHKAETESRYKPAGEDARGVGQVIDLTAHDETEQIDLQGLRSKVS